MSAGSASAAEESNPPCRLRIVSGGQSGVDRAALDAALELGLSCGGWCPRGRWAEDGALSPHYPLRETPGRDPAQRTEWNVRDSDATLILARGPLSGGTALAVELARRYGRPLRIVQLEADPDPNELRRWLAGIETLNVAGPRESQSPGIAALAHGFLQRLLQLPTGQPTSESGDSKRVG